MYKKTCDNPNCNKDFTTVKSTNRFCNILCKQEAQNLGVKRKYYNCIKCGKSIEGIYTRTYCKNCRTKQQNFNDLSCFEIYKFF